MKMAIGVDLGGTKIEALAIDREGRERFRRRRPTPKDDYRDTIEAVAGAVLEAEAELGERATVGLCHPGSVSPATGRMKGSNATQLNGMPFVQDLQNRLDRPIANANDANCLGSSEVADGAAAGAKIAFAVIIGSGCGGSVVVDGKPLEGANAIAGEWGHIPLPWPEDDERPGLECYCGKRGCLETWLSGNGMARVFARDTGRALTAPEIAEAARAGDADAERAWRRYEQRLARGLAVIVNVIDPEVIVLGGGVSRVERIYRNTPGELARWAFSDSLSTKIVPAMHGDSSGVRGAAWLGRALAEG